MELARLDGNDDSWASLELERVESVAGDGEMELENGDGRADWSVVTSGGGRQSKREKRVRGKGRCRCGDGY